MIWRYDGTWSRVDDPFEVEDGKDWVDRARELGYTFTQAWGSSIDAPIEIWEHESAERWLVEWTLADTVHSVFVEGLPHLIDLAAKLATIALAHHARDLHQVLEDTIYVAAEDGDREYRRRHPQARSV